jgi:hypothetical protein
VPGNPIVQLLIFAVIIIWGLFQLFAPGEAQSTGVIVLQWFAVVGASLGAIGAIYKLATGKQLGARETRS